LLLPLHVQPSLQQRWERPLALSGKGWLPRRRRDRTLRSNRASWRQKGNGKRHQQRFRPPNAFTPFESNAARTEP
jgi:hypothetical protein